MCVWGGGGCMRACVFVCVNSFSMLHSWDFPQTQILVETVQVLRP